jgi:hypothetical protein
MCHKGDNLSSPRFWVKYLNQTDKMCLEHKLHNPQSKIENLFSGY